MKAKCKAEILQMLFQCTQQLELIFTFMPETVLELSEDFGGYVFQIWIGHFKIYLFIVGPIYLDWSEKNIFKLSQTI